VAHESRLTTIYTKELCSGNAYRYDKPRAAQASPLPLRVTGTKPTRATSHVDPSPTPWEAVLKNTGV